jgi:radical SAM protein with 4Fe4S-binding SPASM domain
MDEMGANRALDADAMAAAVRAAYRAADLPEAVHLDITYRCDWHCEHCYLDDRDHWPELTPAELTALVHQLHDCGVLYLTWSGGEVFLRPDFLDALALAGRLGFQSRVKTHGANLSADRIARLKDANVRRIDVSAYSRDPAVHAAFTHAPGGLAACDHGVERARNAGIPVRVSVVVLPHTLHEIKDLHAHYTKLGCEVTFQTVFRDHAGSAKLDPLALDAEQLRVAYRQIVPLQGLRDTNPKPLAAGDRSPTCEAGRTSAYIGPDGQVTPCVSFPMPIGNVREQPFREIWQTSPRRKELVAWTNAHRTGCHSCAGSIACFYCPGEAFKVTGDWRTPSPSFHSKTRAKMVALEEAGHFAFRPEQWASVPDPAGMPAPPKRFVFPIYRSRKGHGSRVEDPAHKAAAR